MIRINLAPIDEIEDRHWWIPDVVTFFVLFALTIAGGNYYLGLKRAEVDRLVDEERNLVSSIESMTGEVQKHDELEAKIANLDNLRASFSKITQSKLERYLPLVLLEHIQTLKPDGVWLTGIYFKTENKPNGRPEPVEPPPPPPVDPNAPPQDPMAEAQTPPATTPAPPVIPPPPRNRIRRDIEITGRAFDHVILAEFMTLLKATRNQDYHQYDVRSQIFFDEIGLHFTGITAVPRKVSGITENLEVVEFKIAAYYDQRDEQVDPPNNAVTSMLEGLRMTGQNTNEERL
jgi:hypothetical protein